MSKPKGSRKQYVSTGIRRSSMRTKSRNSADRLLNQMAALRKGKNVKMVFPNPNKEETNRQFVTVGIDGKRFLENRKNFGKSDKKKTVGALDE